MAILCCRKIGGEMNYQKLRPLLFLLPPETAHNLAILSMKLFPPTPVESDPRLATTFAGLNLPNPIGLAAGFDKNAEIPSAMLAAGFGFVEVGTVTPLPQPGNPSPRVFRLVEDEAIINRLGFNGRGMEYVVRKLADKPLGKEANNKSGMLGVNIGANKNSPDRRADYIKGAKRFLPLCDYLTVNISSPNTKGLRDLQQGKELESLLGGILDERRRWHEESGRHVPVFVKLAPDLDEESLGEALALILGSGADGVVLTNTTVDRPYMLRASDSQQVGGLSGRPLSVRSRVILEQAAGILKGDLPIIAVGGVHDGQEVHDRLSMGAGAVQCYTSMVYRGPNAPALMARELCAILDQSGQQSLGDIKKPWDA